MRNLVVIEFLSLDGVMQSPASPDEDPDCHYPHGGWAGQYFDEALMASNVEGMAQTDAYLFGRKTYEGMARHWPHAPADDPFAAHLNPTPKYVASRTPQTFSWQNTTQLDGDVPKAVAELDGTIVVLGSGELVHTLLDNDLVDELRLIVHPIVLGGGKRLFRDSDQPRGLRLIDSATTSKGSLTLAYRPA